MFVNMPCLEKDIAVAVSPRRFKGPSMAKGSCLDTVEPSPDLPAAPKQQLLRCDLLLDIVRIVNQD